MHNQQQIDNLKEELKSYLRGKGWETLHAEVVVDGIVESFAENSLPEGLASYDELARNQGVGTPPPLDEKAIALFDEIKQLIREKE